MNKELPSTFHPSSLAEAFYRGLQKLNPFQLWRSPVMFITEICAFVTTLDIIVVYQPTNTFRFHLAIWLWTTVILANTAEALAEIWNETWRSHLREARSEILSSRYDKDGNLNVVDQKELKKGDLILIRSGDIIPADGEIISGSASIDESSLNGEMQPVVRKAQSSTNTVTAGTKVISDEIVVKVIANPGEGIIDQMIKQVESSKRRKTLSEITLTILLSSLTIIFLIMVLSNQLFARYYHVQLNVTMQIAMLTCLIPTTIASLLYAIEIAGINRLMKKNVIVMSGQSIEIAGKIDILLLDKTATVTSGERQVVSMIPASPTIEEEFMRASFLTSFLDETKEGRSILAYVKHHFPFVCARPKIKYDFIPFSMTNRLSGIDVDEQRLRKGAPDVIEQWMQQKIPFSLLQHINEMAKSADTILVVADQNQVLGLIQLRDQVLPSVIPWFKEFKELGIKTVILSGDTHLATKSMAREIGADQFLAPVGPKEKLEYLKKAQKDGNIVAVIGSGLMDVPCLSQADLSIAMNNGAQPAKEAANMIDLDSNPSKLFEIIQVGKQLLMTRGALTAFSIANDLAKYFIIIPSVLSVSIPDFERFNVLHFSSPQNAVLSVVIFNVLALVSLIPLALKGVKVATHHARWILSRHLLIYGLGGLILPIIGIKLIDMVLRYYTFSLE